MQDLAALVAEFVFFVGLVVDHLPGQGQDVESDGAGEDVGRRVTDSRTVEGQGGRLFADRLDLQGELVHSPSARA